MSREEELKMTLQDENDEKAPTAPEPSAGGRRADTGAAGSQFFTESQFLALVAMGEEPREYQQLMESLVEDLQPRPGLERQLVEQMGETFWGMRRAQRMRNGLALKNIQSKLVGEEMAASINASQGFALLEPFERLRQALARRNPSPTAEEIDAFVESRKHDSSQETQEFILLLTSLKGLTNGPERKSIRRKARAQLRKLMEAYAILAWQYSRQVEKVKSPENLAALMAPDDQKCRVLQRMEDSHLLRLWRLTNTLGKVRQGIMEKREIKVIRSKPECV